MMVKCLITGGAGFIGSHLAELLLAKGEQVTIIDDLSTGSINNIEHLKTERHFSYHIDTIMNQALMAELVDGAEEIYHLAAAVGVKLIVESPVRTIETNIKGTEIVLELASKKGKRVLVVSSSEVYGKNPRDSYQEEDNLVLGATVRPRWSYACSKAITEFLALAYWRERKLPVVIVRLFNTVGPRQTGRYGMVVPRFAAQALLNRPITVYGDGKQTRCFLQVKDAARALLGLMREPRALGEVVNVGGSEETTIVKLAERIKQMTQSSSEIVFIPYEEAYDQQFEDMLHRFPDTTKLKKLIGFKTEYDLQATVNSVIEFCKQLDNLEILI